MNRGSKPDGYLGIPYADVAGLSWAKAFAKGARGTVYSRDRAEQRWIGPALQRRLREAAASADERAVLDAYLDLQQERAERPNRAGAAMLQMLGLVLALLAVVAAIGIGNDWSSRAYLGSMLLVILCAGAFYALEDLTTHTAARSLACVVREARRIVADVDAHAARPWWQRRR